MRYSLLSHCASMPASRAEEGILAGGWKVGDPQVSLAGGRVNLFAGEGIVPLVHLNANEATVLFDARDPGGPALLGACRPV